MSVYSVVLVIYDKTAAVKRKFRIPENALMWLGFLGGAEAMFLTMKGIHHKTRVKKFMIALPLFFVLHLMMLGTLIYFIYFYKQL